MRRVHQFLIMGNTVNGVFFFGRVFSVSSWCLVHMGSSGLSRLPVVYRTWVTLGVPPARHALWAEVGGGITFVILWEEYFKSP